MITDLPHSSKLSQHLCWRYHSDHHSPSGRDVLSQSHHIKKSKRSFPKTLIYGCDSWWRQWHGRCHQVWRQVSPWLLKFSAIRHIKGYQTEENKESHLPIMVKKKNSIQFFMGFHIVGSLPTFKCLRLGPLVLSHLLHQNISNAIDDEISVITSTRLLPSLLHTRKEMPVDFK